ncbi:carbohydrate kinase [Vaginisenegalia massiliensis]|uniref:carbohydrate kinase n=1 Tax=Vaginisenegalia massiliensis TaxID=2058294 RepID=UPI000F543F82|nr:carbohydrate kinase [Vaginisenegalia massiliensis]
MLNFNERRVLKLIEEDPFLSQQSIADQLDVPRSTVATIISNLTTKKQLLGRAYIVNKQPEVFCIGAMNVDRKFVLNQALIRGTSNPVSSSVSIGGVARNVAENLGRLDVKVSLISLAGQDKDYELIKQNTQGFVNLQHVQQLPEASTSNYTAVLEQSGELDFAFADMDICQLMTAEWIESYQLVLSQARMIVADLNVSQDAVAKIIEIANKEAIDLMLVSVSTPKMSHLPKNLNGVTWLIINEEESRAYFEAHQLAQPSEEDLLKTWLDLGVENIVITHGAQPTRYANRQGDMGHIQPPMVDHVEDVTGAGDAFSAGVVCGYLDAYSLHEAIEFGLTNSYYTIQSEQTVRKDLTKEILRKQHKALKGSFK